MKQLITCILILSCIGVYANNDKDSAKFYLQKAIIEKQHPHIAFQFLQKALSFDKENIEVLSEYASVTMELRKYEFSKDALEQLYKADNKNEKVIEDLAHVYLYLRKFDEAIVFGKKMIENGIGTDADYIVGKSEYENENYYDAVRFLEGYYKRVSDRPEIPYIIARCYVELSQYKKAADYFEKTIAIDSNNFYRIYEMALVYSAIPDEKSAIKYFELAAAKGLKKDNDYYENLGNSYASINQMEKAIESYNMVLKRKPNDPDILTLVAECYYKTGNYTQAIEYWSRILQNDPKHARSLYMVGMSYQKKGEKDKGQAICEKAIELDPSLANNKHQTQLNPGL